MLAPEVGNWPVISSLITFIWASSILVLVSREREPATPSRGDAALARYTAALRNMLSRSTTWLGLGLAVLAGTAFESVGSVAGPFMIDRGLSERAIGVFFVVFPVAGALAGGYASDRAGRRSAVAVFVVFTVACVWALAAIDAVAPPSATLVRVAPLAALYLGIGLLTAASYALFMDLTDPRLGATQFSAFMGATNLCESASAMSVGRLIPAVGYSVAFVVLSMASRRSLPILWLLPPVRQANAAR
jgi:MFS family permease